MFLQAGAAGQGSASLIMLVAMIGFFYFFAIRPQKKKEKEIQSMRDALKAGDEVITIGGMEGKVVQAKEDYVVLEMKPSKIKMQFTKWAIGSVKKQAKEKEEAEDKAIEAPIEEVQEAEVVEE